MMKKIEPSEIGKNPDLIASKWNDANVNNKPN
jgi:hypothetical protein